MPISYPITIVYSVFILAITGIACLPVRKEIIMTGIILAFSGFLIDAVVFFYRPKKHRTFNLITIIRLYIWLVMGGSFTFLFMYLQDKRHFNGMIHEDNLVLDFNYFTVTTFSTVGYGDIVASTPLARTIVALYILLTVFINVVVINMFISYVRFKFAIVARL